MLLGIPLLGGLMPLLFFEGTRNHSFSENLLTISISILSTYLFWKMDKGIIIYFRKKRPHHKDYIRRLSLQLVVITVISFLILHGLLLSGIYHLSENQIPAPTEGELLAGMYTITFFVIAIYEAMYFFDLWKIQTLENEKLKTENAKAQLNVLKNQINPHFLFNSFNTLVSIIPEDTDTAVKFTTELSHFYRFILALKDKELIPLSQELECVESFIYLLKIRFEERLIVHKDIDVTSLNKYIVPLSLQILVENATKHNIVSQTKPLTISIQVSNHKICVENNIQLKREIESTQTGLRNIRQRYQLLTQNDITITNLDQRFKVCLPLIDVKKL